MIMEQTSILHPDRFGPQTNNNIKDLLHTIRFFIDENNYRDIEALLHRMYYKAAYDRMIVSIIILYLFPMEMHQKELIFSCILHHPSFNIITQYIQSKSSVTLQHGLGQGTIAAVYLQMLSYNVVLIMSNKTYEGAIFRTKKGHITARILVPTCVEDSIILTNKTGAMNRSINSSNTHIQILMFNGETLNFYKGCYLHLYPTTNKPFTLTINQEKVKIKRLRNS